VHRPRGEQRLHALAEAAQVEQRQDLQVVRPGDLVPDLDVLAKALLDELDLHVRLLKPAKAKRR